MRISFTCLCTVLILVLPYVSPVAAAVVLSHYADGPVPNPICGSLEREKNRRNTLTDHVEKIEKKRKEEREKHTKAKRNKAKNET